MSKHVVVGSNSFTGGCYVQYLLDRPETSEVVALSRSPEKSELFLPYLTHSKKNKVRFIQADLNQDLERITSIVREFQPDYISTFAAQSEVAPSWENPNHWYQTNVVAMHAFYFALKDFKFIKKVLHTSSPEVYGSCSGYIREDAPLNPSTPYAASKAGGDLALLPLIKNFGLPLVMIRATNIYGKHQQLFKIIPRTAINILLGKQIELHGGGKAVKSYIHSHDVCSGTYAALTRGTAGEIYHLSPKDGGISVKDVVQTICDELGVEFSKAAVAVEERLGQDAAYTIDSTKARTQLGWDDTIDRKDGIQEVVRWVKDNLAEIEKQPLGYVHVR